MIINEDFFDETDIEVEPHDTKDEHYDYVFELHCGDFIPGNNRMMNYGNELISGCVSQLQSLLNNLQFINNVVVEDSDDFYLIKILVNYALKNNERCVKEVIAFLKIIDSVINPKTYEIILQTTDGKYSETLNNIHNYFSYLKAADETDVCIWAVVQNKALSSFTNFMEYFFKVGYEESNAEKRMKTLKANLYVSVPYFTDTFIWATINKIKKEGKIHNSSEETLFMNICDVNKNEFRSLLDNVDVYRDLGVEIQFSAWDINLPTGKPYMFSLDEVRNESTKSDSYNGNVVLSLVRNILKKTKKYRIYPANTAYAQNKKDGSATAVLMFQIDIQLGFQNICYYIRIDGDKTSVEKALKRLFVFNGNIFN